MVDENLQLVSDKKRAKREKAFAKRSRQQREDAEVEKSTSIDSGIPRMVDLVRGLPGSVDAKLYLVAPNRREKRILAQLRRLSLSTRDRERLSCILFPELDEHRSSIRKLGTDHTITQRIAKQPVGTGNAPIAPPQRRDPEKRLRSAGAEFSAGASRQRARFFSIPAKLGAPFLR